MKSLVLVCGLALALCCLAAAEAQEVAKGGIGGVKGTVYVINAPRTR